MSSEWRAPAPLPMYQPVVLKHVPTMVRRKYDRLNVVDDLILDQPQPQPQGSVSEDDGCDRSEMEHLEFIADTDVKHQTLDNGLENLSDDQGSCQSQDDSQQDYNLSGEMDASVSVGGHHSRLGNSTDDCVTRTYSESISNGSTGQTDLDSENSKSKDDGSNGANYALIMDSNPHEDESHEPKHKRLASFSNEQALHSKYSENEDDEPKVADHAPNMVTGRPAPPPLPMYHPVVLHHVPTMVRRKYEHFDTDKLDQIEDEPKNDGEDDGDLDSINNEDNLRSENSSCEQGSALEDDDCDGSDMKHSSCIIDAPVKGWRQSEDDDLQDSNPSSEVDDGISVESQLNGEENSADYCESGAYCERVGTRSIKPTELDSKDTKIKDDWPKVANHAPVVDSNLDEDDHETTHKRLAFLSNEQALHSENSESDNDVPKLFNHVPMVEFNHENGMQDKTLVDFNTEEGNSKDEYNGPEGAESASYTGIIDKGFDMIEGISVNEQGPSSEENKRVRHLSEGNSPFCAIVSLNSLAEEMGRGSFDDKQDMVYKTQASKKSIEEDRCKLQGRCSPPPLPMYRPVALKHVPTMVRKRYERSDVEPLHQIEDVPTNDGEFEDDGDLDDEGGLLSENISSEQGWHEGEADDLQNSNSSSNVDSCVSVECQQNEVENSIDDCETGIYNEIVSSRDIQPTDLHSENIESEDDESKVANTAPIVDSNLDEGETQDKRPSLALHSEYSERKDDEPEFAYHAPIVDSNLENVFQDKRLVDFSNEQGDIKDEYNGAEDAKTASYPSAKYDSLDMTGRNSTDEQGLHLEDNKRDGDESEGNSSFCTTASLKSEAEVIECGSFDDDEQDTITQMHTEDFGTQNIIGKSLDNVNLKSASNGTEGTNSNYNMHTAVETKVQDESQWYSNYQKEFEPETLGKILEENGYELYCPNCKHCFTNPLIVQRKGNGQHCRISCFTSLIALFCSGRD
ncbi:uncharacterized protein LOC141642712 isoform X3 [Silene latifolia]|uniref:uncharacterized protein LOC141642712 isoform X3 n=1 Tax=Silene latifolia TaxID=37657 RepID=UPI003D7818CD